MATDYYSTKLSKDEWTIHGRRHHIQIDRTEAPTGRADHHGEDILQSVYYVHDRSRVIDTADQYDTDPHGFTRLKDAQKYAVEKLREYDDRVDPRIGARDNPDKIYTHWITFDPSKKNLIWANKVFQRGERYAIARIYNHPNGIDAVLEVISPDTWNDLQLDVSSMSSPLYHASRKPSGLGNGLEVDRWEKIYGKLMAPRVKNGEVVLPR